MRTQVLHLVKVLYRERLQSKLLQDAHKHVEEVMQDRFGMDSWVQARIVERLFSCGDEQSELKRKLAERLEEKRAVINDLVQKEAEI